MTYKHKDHMEWLLQKTDYYTENAVTEERIKEIREVYAKAKAFDEFCVLFERHFYANKESDINYLTEEEFVKAVEELRSNEGWSDVK